MESLKLLRASFKTGITRNVEFRKNQLKAMFKMVEEHENDICQALKKDMNKCEMEAKMTEILMVKQEISYLLKNMDSWLVKEKTPKTFLTVTDSCHIQKQPFGVALLICPWNYPFQLAIVPLAGLIAAGNCVIVKPSEVSSHTEELIANLLPKYLASEVCRVELGDGKRTSEILKERFDLIMYTGSPSIGKIVMEAASRHLTPVVLELGGKSPTFVDHNVDMKMAAKRIVWSKYLNAGQVCVAPDYILCHKDIKSEFIEACIHCIEEFYTKNPLDCPDYCRIINKRHHKRLMDVIQNSKGKIICGGEGNEDKRFIEPTIVVLDSLEDSLMKDELFGPVMPIITVKSDEEAIEIINNREKPLALYVFSNDKQIWKKFERETTSGTLMINDCVVHNGIMGIPFGGVGESGMGYYHGKYSIDQFSHHRPIVNRSTTELAHNLFRYPPFNSTKLSWAEWGLKADAKESGSYCSIM